MGVKSEYLSVRVHVPLSEEEQQLLLGELDVDVGEGHHVEAQVPGGVLQNVTDRRHVERASQQSQTRGEGVTAVTDPRHAESVSQ